jgi:hypothetical protein
MKCFADTQQNNVVMLNVAFFTVMLCVIMQNIVMLSVIILNVVQLNVMAPLQQVALAFWAQSHKTFVVKLLILLSKLFHFITVKLCNSYIKWTSLQKEVVNVLQNSLERSALGVDFIKLFWYKLFS